MFVGWFRLKPDQARNFRENLLEAAPIGGLLFAHGNSERPCKASRLPLVTAGCIDTDLHPQVEVTPATQANLSSRSHTCIMQCGSCSLKPAVTYTTRLLAQA